MEAAKCYTNALRQDPDSTQILGDLAQLQVQLRDPPGFVTTRTRLLQLKPGARGSWVALAVAHQLAGRPETAASVLETFLDAAAEPPPAERYEHSELLLYRAELLEAAGRAGDALALLQACAPRLVDKPSLNEALARLHLATGDWPAAEAVYRQMLGRNPDCAAYHAGLRCALLQRASVDLAALSAEEEARLASEYVALQAAYPRSGAARRQPLDFLCGAAFESALAAYIAPFLRKGVPALSSDLAPLYARAGGPAWRDAALGRVLGAAEEGLRARAALPGGAEGSEQPGVLPWAQLALSQHHGASGAPAAGLPLAEAAIAHTPTCPDFYLGKAKLLGALGDAAGAAEACEEARALDAADRYLNSVSVQALLAAGQLERAEAVGALFSRAGAGGGPAADGCANLVEMQCQWWTLGVADLHRRAGRLGPALKAYHQVRKYFEDFAEDQFDFHAYCLRKVTLRAYTRLLTLVDSLPGEAYFRAAARGAISAYLALHDARARAGAAAAEAEEAHASLPPAERKKARAKARKAEAAAAEAAAAARAGGKGMEAAAKPADPDPHGALLASTADPLGEAARWLSSLLRHAAGAEETQVAACEVYSRKGRLLLALRAARALVAAGGGGREVRLAQVRVAAAAEAALRAGGLAPPVELLLKEGLEGLLGGCADARAFAAARAGDDAEALAASLALLAV